MFKLKMAKDSTVSGSLVSYFSDAMISIVGLNQARNIAKEIEFEVIDNLNAVEPHNGVFLTPSDIPSEVANELVQGSMNAHLSLVQAKQIEQKTTERMIFLDKGAKQFIGKEIVLVTKDNNHSCIDAVMFNKNDGQYRVSSYNKMKIKGKIKDISLQNNLLIVEPTKLARIINPSRILFYVYVINQEDLNPQISIL